MLGKSPRLNSPLFVLSRNAAKSFPIVGSASREPAAFVLGEITCTMTALILASSFFGGSFPSSLLPPPPAAGWTGGGWTEAGSSDSGCSTAVPPPFDASTAGWTDGGCLLGGSRSPWSWICQKAWESWSGVCRPWSGKKTHTCGDFHVITDSGRFSYAVFAICRKI